MDSQLKACITMQSAFQPISKKNGGDEGDKHNNNSVNSAVNNGSMLSIGVYILTTEITPGTPLTAKLIQLTIKTD